MATPPHPTGKAHSGKVYAALLEENHRLRDELARPHHPLPPITPQPPALPVRLGKGTWGWDGGQSRGTPRKQCFGGEQACWGHHLGGISSTVG